MPGAGEDFCRRTQDIGAPAVTRIQFAHEHVYELRDVLWRTPVHDIEIVRRYRRALSDRCEQTDDDEFNVARR